MIVQQKNHVITKLSITNYNTYQSDGTTDSTTDGQQTVQQTDTNKNDKKEKNDKNDKTNIYSPVIDYLNLKSEKKYQASSKKTKDLINARLNEGFKEEDFYKVIDIKSSQWMYSDMNKFLRPSTLFSNNFEGYLNEYGEKIISENALETLRKYF